MQKIRIMDKINKLIGTSLIGLVFLLLFISVSAASVSAQEWITLDGSGEIRVNDANSLDGFTEATWNMWINQNEYIKNAGIVGKYKANSGARAYLIRTSLVNGNPVISFAISEDGINVGSYTSESSRQCGIRLDDRWTMITVTYDGFLITYYRNGEICDTDTTILNSIYSSTSPLSLGGGNSIFFNGDIDEYTFYNRKLAPEQISRLYDESMHGTALGDSIPVLVYHEIKTPATDLIMVTPEDFALQMNYLDQNDFTTVTLKDYLNWKKGDFIMPNKSIILIFDDGFESVFTEAKPIMDQYGFVGTVATVTRYASFTGNNTGYMKWGEINSLIDGGWDVESHSVTHSHMLSLNESEFRFELNDSKNMIVNKTENTPTSFVFPFHESNSSYTQICGIYYDLCWTQGSLNPSYDYISNNGKEYLGLRRINVVNIITIDDFGNFLGRDTDKFGEWNMDEGFGSTTADTSGNQNTGNLNAGAFWPYTGNNLVFNKIFAVSTDTRIASDAYSISNSKNKKDKKLDGLDNVIDSDHGKSPMKIKKDKKKYPINMDIEGKYYATHDPIKLEEEKTRKNK